MNFTLFIPLLIHAALKRSVNFHTLSNLSKLIGSISNLARIAKWRAFLKMFMYSSTAGVCYQLCINHGVFFIYMVTCKYAMSDFNLLKVVSAYCILPTRFLFIEF